MGFVVLLVIFALLVLVVLPIWVFVKITGFASENEVQQSRLNALEQELRELRQRVNSGISGAAAPTATTPVRQPAIALEPITPPPVAVSAPEVPPISPEPPPLVFASEAPAAPSAPPPIPEPPFATSPAHEPLPEPAPRLQINWEQFMGAKLFAWLGGFAAFLAVAFFVKYSIEHDFIPIQVRVAIGFVISAGLIVGGLLMNADRFRITAQVLCAAGVVSLYAVTFACNAVYHFKFFGPLPTFALMTLITATAFLLAVRMSAQVVAILGLLGGFLTPVLIKTGHDNALGLFVFVALLDLGLVAVALRQRWLHLIPLAAGGTILTLIGWAQKFFEVPKAGVAVTACLGFTALFIAVTEIGRRFGRVSIALTASAATIAITGFGFVGYFETFPTLSTQPLLFFGFLFALDALLLTLVWRDDTADAWQMVAGGLAFGLLAIWTTSRLTNDLLPWALAAYLLFAILHTAFPLVLRRLQPERHLGGWSQVYPPLALLLLMGPLFQSEAVSLLFWPAVLLVDVIAVALALATASLVALAVVLLLTLGAMGVCIFKVPGTAVDFGGLLWVVAGFAVFFFAAGLFLARRLGLRRLPVGEGANPLTRLFGDTSAQIPAFSALLPFLLLIMMSQRLAMPVPSSLFGLGLLCCLLVLGLSRLLLIPWLPLCGLVGVAALEFAWHARRFDVAQNVTLPLFWYLGFYALFAVFPFLFRRHFANTTGPWAVAALSGVAHFPLVYDVVRRAWPNFVPGLVPAAFAIAPLLSLALILRAPDESESKRLNQLAWFGGTALLFITLIFPIQFDRQWITISWALEGVALLWLYHRVPHAGLRATGVILLLVAFGRLALNPAVLSYHPRSDTPIFNWYLYAYGVTLLCLFASARLLAPPRERVLGINYPPIGNALGAILAFLLLNIEIADYFSTTGSSLTFQFAGNFARDLAYTVGWALFALTLLSVGIWKATRAARFAALALLGVTVLKLFFHDLAQLGQLYRVGALVVVAVVAILASFLYQRFVPQDGRPKSS
jgi:uncharacterized membrane protein